MNPMQLRAGLALILAAFALPAAHASEAIFTHTYTAETTPEGTTEVEQQVTYRTKRSQGTYKLVQSRTEIEYGITSRWQASLYLNAYSVTAENNNSTASRNNYTAVGDGDEVTGGGPVTAGPYVPFAELLPLPSARYKKSDFESVSLESVYQFTSPYKDGLGLAGYAEVTLGDKVKELEFKLLAQKNLMEGDLVLAGNLAIGFEKESWSGVGSEKETEMVLSGGASYRLGEGWRAGLELRNERVWEGGYSLASSKRDYSAWFGGPTLHYAAERWFATLGYQTQLPWATAYSAAAKDELVGDRVYKNSERHTWKLIAGFTF